MKDLYAELIADIRELEQTTLAKDRIPTLVLHVMRRTLDRAAQPPQGEQQEQEAAADD